ncbi:MAG TPA: FAD-dependent oxidoreductase [Anseongella sp.]|nr:FAD-dependent oxidoreductase [Anseongella sp.]
MIINIMVNSKKFKSRPVALALSLPAFMLMFSAFACNTVNKARGGNSEYDICVYGGTSAGVIAAYTAKKMGKSVLLVEPGDRLGGLTSGGLGYTDIGNKYAVTGLALDFYRRMGRHYGKFEQWIFEPRVADSLFKDYIERADVDVFYGHRIHSAVKEEGLIREIVLENAADPGAAPGRTVSAKMFIDCSYEGDLMAKAGVSYTTGREANSQYGETYNGVQLMQGHQFPDGIDPYKVPGEPESGLLWGISPEPLAAQGSGDKKIQAYNFRICLTDDPGNMVPITRPAGYDSTRYDLLLRLFEAQPQKRKLNDYFIWSRMPGNKTDINNRGAFSTDMIGMNHDYPEADYEARKAIVKQHEDYTKGLLYFYGHDPRVPEELRAEMLKWGYPRDEYSRNGHWSPQLYVREVRRMIGGYVMTQANCVGREVVRDGVGMAAYTMDSHNCQRIVIEKEGRKMVKNEGNVEIGGFGPYPVSYRSLVPKAEECRNLLVPVCLSASHIAYGSIRMEPVFMVLAQSSAVAASMAIDSGEDVQQVEAARVRDFLRTNPLADGSTPEIMVDNRDAEQLRVRGGWKAVKKGSYGPDMLLLDSASSAAHAVRFIPEITESGEYDVYTYYPRLMDGASETSILIAGGKETREVIVKKEAVTIEGQTSGEWVHLGTTSLEKGKEAYVEISGKDADGAIVADAVLWVPVKQ